MSNKETLAKKKLLLAQAFSLFMKENEKSSTVFICFMIPDFRG